MAQKCVASKRVLNCVPRMQIISCSVARNEVLLDSFNEIYQHGMLFEDVYKRLPTTLRVKKSLVKNAFYRYKNKKSLTMCIFREDALSIISLSKEMCFNIKKVNRMRSKLAFEKVGGLSDNDSHALTWCKGA